MTGSAKNIEHDKRSNSTKTVNTLKQSEPTDFAHDWLKNGDKR